VDEPVIESPIFLGGPVQPNSLHILHRVGSRIEGSKSVRGRTFWGGRLEALARMISDNEAKQSDVRFFVGYSGWGEGQLTEEIEKGGWILANSDDTVIFDTDPHELWRVLMRKMGGEYALVSTYPDDPTLN